VALKGPSRPHYPAILVSARQFRKTQQLQQYICNVLQRIYQPLFFPSRPFETRLIRQYLARKKGNFGQHLPPCLGIKTFVMVPEALNSSQFHLNMAQPTSKVPPMKDLTIDNITENTVVINSQCPDQRLTYLMERLVTHLHDFARETRLSTTEWMAALDFLVRVGQISSDVRHVSTIFMCGNSRPEPAD
jgi:hypothetical protein